MQIDVVTLESDRVACECPTTRLYTQSHVTSHEELYDSGGRNSLYVLIVSTMVIN